MGPAYLYCTDSCLLNNQELSLLKYNYTNWYCVQQFPKWWYLEILHPAPLKLALSHPGGPCCFPSGESILLLPILPYPFPPSWHSWPEWFHWLTDDTVLYIFIHSFERLMRLSYFPSSPNFGTSHTLILWSVWCREAHGSHVPVCVVVPFWTASSRAK